MPWKALSEELYLGGGEGGGGEGGGLEGHAGLHPAEPYIQ
jgi:hypothetical protein